MARVERIRESVAGTVDAEHFRQKSEAGWKLSATVNALNCVAG